MVGRYRLHKSRWNDWSTQLWNSWFCCAWCNVDIKLTGLVPWFLIKIVVNKTCKTVWCMHCYTWSIGSCTHKKDEIHLDPSNIVFHTVAFCLVNIWFNMSVGWTSQNKWDGTYSVSRWCKTIAFNRKLWAVWSVHNTHYYSNIFLVIFCLLLLWYQEAFCVF